MSPRPALACLLAALLPMACGEGGHGVRSAVAPLHRSRAAASERPVFELRPGDPGYFALPGRAQALPMTARIRRLVLPTLGAPALAVSGGLLTVWIAASGASERASATQASLRLETHVAGQALVLPLTLVRAVAGGEGNEGALGGEGSEGAHGGRAGLIQGVVRLLFRVPASAPRETFDLVAALPGSPTERQPRAVRVLHADPGARPFRFALLADQQLWDPSVAFSSGRRSARAHPTWGERQESRAVARQGLHELGLWDPEFAVQLGDVVFGLDYEKELDDALSVLGTSPVAGFQVPGNHDAYARYGLDLRLGAAGLAAAALRCRHLLPGGREDASVAGLWRLVLCVGGLVKERLFGKLLYDGLAAYRRNLGPPYYSFRVGRFQFIALNTYDGTPERRHAYSLWLDLLGRHLGAPLVDNYGGYVTEAQLRFVEKEARTAAAQGLTVVFLGHHDPRGNAEGQAFHENEPFPTSPVGLGQFEEWNYDGAWDSDPSDGRGRERPTDHSGHALLRLVARYGSAYLCGHVHRDEQRTYRRGERILGEVVAQRDVTFLRVTTASSSTSKGSYWGYRIVTALPDGTLSLAPLSEGLPSVPVGNLWVEGEGKAVPASAPFGTGLAVRSGLPAGVEVRVRATLPLGAAPGYRFGARAPARVRLEDMHLLGDGRREPVRAIHYLRLSLPAAPAEALREASQLLATDLRAAPAAGNRPPEPVVLAGGRVLAAGRPLALGAGEARELDASPSRDPDGDALLAPLWRWRDAAGRELGGGRGPKLVLRVARPGRYQVELLLWDERGARSTWGIPVRAR